MEGVGARRKIWKWIGVAAVMKEEDMDWKSREHGRWERRQSDGE
jgi:hypothetical protein